MNQRERYEQIATLWTDSQPAVHAFISSVIPQFCDSEDILQSVAATVIQKADQYDPSRPFIGWAIGLAKIEMKRFRRSQFVYVTDALQELAEAFEEMEPILQERRRALGPCLEALTERAQVVLTKRYAEGLKSAAIAEEIGITSNHVSVILHRAYQTLRRCIQRRLATEVDPS